MKKKQITDYSLISNVNGDYASTNIVLNISSKAVSSIAVAEASEIDGVWIIARVYVRPKHRLKGFGSAVLKELKKKIRETDGKQIWVTPGGYGYEPKLQKRFYRKHGFRKQKESVAIYGSYKFSF